MDGQSDENGAWEEENNGTLLEATCDKLVGHTAYGPENLGRFKKWLHAWTESNVPEEPGDDLDDDKDN